MSEKKAHTSSDSGSRYRKLLFAGELPQIVLYLSPDLQVVRCDKSLAGSTFALMPDICRSSAHEYLHGHVRCNGNCDFEHVLIECAERLVNESIVEVEAYDRVLGRLLRLRYVRPVDRDANEADSILHVIDITEGREVTHSLQDTNRQLKKLFAKKEYELSVSKERSSEQLRDMGAHLKSLSSRLIMAQEQERNRISSDLHDGVGQHLSLARYNVEKVQQLAGETSVDVEMLAPLVAIMRHVDESIQEVRRITRNLNPSMLEEFGIVATVELLIHEFVSSHADISAKTTINASEVELPAERSVAIIRIIQEALNNISKHSKATRVDMAITIHRKGVLLVLTDNGVGFNLDDYKATEPSVMKYGLANMHDRARSTGGSIVIDSRPGSGTKVEAAWINT